MNPHPSQFPATAPVPTPVAPVASDTNRPTSAKFVIAGGFGVGKTTFVGAVSEIPPLRTEEQMTEAASAHDDVSKVTTKQSTTVAMDFGRITVSPQLVLYLFGTPGQNRFSFMWDKICMGALGAVVLVDTRRFEDSFVSVDYFEKAKIPFVVAVNNFPDSPIARAEDIRDGLSLAESVPVVSINAQDKEDVKTAVITLIDLLMSRMATKSRAQSPKRRDLLNS